jgi:DNA sulfur modification protein DndC
MARESAFVALGFDGTVDAILEEATTLYKADAIPWVVGYSGGKDSTAVLSLVWMMLARLPVEERFKPVHVISTDTLVENPVVASWVSQSLATMRSAAEAQQLPINPNRLTPDVESTFWVNLIGRGYPAPRPKFRWCTERLKIKPANAFVRRVVRENGEAILVLGTRKAESTSRRARMERVEAARIREKLSPNESLPNSLIYSPIEDWSNDDVWLFLMQQENPWGYDNRDLLSMYRGASADNECPLVVDTSTPSCGDSRFGCWVCTLVEKDKSMSAMIQNDEEKEWMIPLLELRDALDIADDRHLRDFRRMTGQVQLFGERTIPGPYTAAARRDWLRRLLEAQRWIRENGPDNVNGIELVTDDELRMIRRIWVIDKKEIEDDLPGIYEEVMGVPYFDGPIDDQLVISADDLGVLREICDSDDLHYQLVRDLLDVERRYKSMARRSGLFEAMEKVFTKNFFDGEDDAIQRARRIATIRENPLDAELPLEMTGDVDAPA